MICYCFLRPIRKHHSSSSYITGVPSRVRTKKRLNPRMVSTRGFDPTRVKMVGSECSHHYLSFSSCILGDPGADSGDEGKSKRAEKCGTKKSKERREEPLGTMSYQTSSKRSPPFWLLIGARKTQVFWHQSEARTGATVWN